MFAFLKLTPAIAKLMYRGKQYGNRWSFETPKYIATKQQVKLLGKILNQSDNRSIFEMYKREE